MRRADTIPYSLSKMETFFEEIIPELKFLSHGEESFEMKFSDNIADQLQSPGNLALFDGLNTLSCIIKLKESLSFANVKLLAEILGKLNVQNIVIIIGNISKDTANSSPLTENLYLLPQQIRLRSKCKVLTIKLQACFPDEHLDLFLKNWVQEIGEFNHETGEFEREYDRLRFVVREFIIICEKSKKEYLLSLGEKLNQIVKKIADKEFIEMKDLSILTKIKDLADKIEKFIIKIERENIPDEEMRIKDEEIQEFEKYISNLIHQNQKLKDVDITLDFQNNFFTIEQAEIFAKYVPYLHNSLLITPNNTKINFDPKDNGAFTQNELKTYLKPYQILFNSFLQGGDRLEKINIPFMFNALRSATHYGNQVDLSRPVFNELFKVLRNKDCVQEISFADDLEINTLQNLVSFIELPDQIIKKLNADFIIERMVDLDRLLASIVKTNLELNISIMIGDNGEETGFINIKQSLLKFLDSLLALEDRTPSLFLHFSLDPEIEESRLNLFELELDNELVSRLAKVLNKYPKLNIDMEQSLLIYFSKVQNKTYDKENDYKKLHIETTNLMLLRRLNQKNIFLSYIKNEETLKNNELILFKSFNKNVEWIKKNQKSESTILRNKLENFPTLAMLCWSAIYWHILEPNTAKNPHMIIQRLEETKLAKLIYIENNNNIDALAFLYMLDEASFLKNYVVPNKAIIKSCVPHTRISTLLFETKKQFREEIEKEIEVKKDKQPVEDVEMPEANQKRNRENNNDEKNTKFMRHM